MNDAIDTNAVKIAQYLEDGMSPEEEVAFMEELNRDEALRKSFEEELLLREILAAHAGAETVAAGQGTPAAHRQATQAPPVLDAPAPRVLSLFRVRAISAACVAIILTAVGIARLPVFERRYATDPGELVRRMPGEVSHLPGTPEGTGQVRVVVTPDSLFAQFYGTYTGEKDPVEVSLYYQHYREGDYASVLAAREEDYRLMGTGKKTDVLNQYMQLYRGLSYLAERQQVRALGQFDSLLNSPHTTKEVYCSAQWYAVLCSLQRKDIPADAVLAAAAHDARAIRQSGSPYRQKATLLLELLSAHRP
jgi:hypothetical protein